MVVRPTTEKCKALKPCLKPRVSCYSCHLGKVVAAPKTNDTQPADPNEENASAKEPRLEWLFRRLHLLLEGASSPKRQLVRVVDMKSPDTVSMSVTQLDPPSISIQKLQAGFTGLQFTSKHLVFKMGDIVEFAEKYFEFCGSTHSRMSPQVS